VLGIESSFDDSGVALVNSFGEIKSERRKTHRKRTLVKEEGLD